MPTGSKHLSGKWRFLTLVLLVTAGIPVWGGATDEDQTAKEIDHLLVYIGGSTCQFIRNDKTYDAAAAPGMIDKLVDEVSRDMELGLKSHLLFGVPFG